MSRRRARFLQALALVGAVTALSGCSTEPSPPYESLTREQTTSDQLPEGVNVTDNGLETSTSRFEGEFDGYRIYLARSTNDSETCIVLAPDDVTNAMVGCSGGGWLTVTDSSRFTATFVATGSDRATGEATRLSANVFVGE